MFDNNSINMGEIKNSKIGDVGHRHNDKKNIFGILLIIFLFVLLLLFVFGFIDIDTIKNFLGILQFAK